MEQKIKSKKNSNSKIKQKKKDNTFYVSPLDSMYINGDSLYELKQLPDNSIDMVFTSPPYYNAKTEYSEYDSYNSYLDFIQQIIHEIKRVLMPGKFFIIDSSPVLIPRIDRSHSSTRIGVPFDIHGLFIKEGYEFVDDIIWEKPEGAGWASGRGRRFAADRNPMQYKPVPVTENIMVYRNGTDHLIDWYIHKHPDQELVQNSKIIGDYEKTNIWRINPATDKRHPAIFPRELAKKVIQYYSFKNDVVLDPFGGLATTAKAAIELDRRFVSIELNDDYYREGLKDLDKEFAIYLDNVIIKNND